MNDYLRIEPLVDDLVVANRALALHGVLDAFGHVSARHPMHADRFLLSRSVAPEVITADDIMTFDLEGAALGGDPRQPYLERFIHAEIYRYRPDVMAIVHSHAPNVIGFTASSVKLRAIYHMGAFLREGAPVWDIADGFGPTNLLVSEAAHGQSLAACLGRGSVVLMRGHGYVTVGDDLPTAVSRALYTNVNAALQSQAIGLGGHVRYLSLEEALLAELMLKATVERPWNLWKRLIIHGRPEGRSHDV